MKRVALIGVVAIVVASAVAIVWHGLVSPVGHATTLTVDAGATLRPVLRELADRGVLAHPRWLYYYARLRGEAEIRSGEYDVEATQASIEIVAMLHRGQVKTDSFTVAEGLNRWQVRDQLVSERWVTAAEFDRLCDDGSFLARHQIPGPTCDGYLFPETYTFARGVAAESLFAEMFAVYQREFAAATAHGRGPLDLGVRELTTLASIVEKETGDAEERPRIACLFYNRLRATPPWRLDTDPTVIYAATLVDPTFDGNLRTRHLRLEHPYNTYRHVGLPPGPIASPGRAALQAVVQPSECNDFFFVSMNNGRHEFCPTLACHERAVQEWQVDYFARRR